MNREDMLARLIAQASAEGGELVTLRAIVEEASELGASRTLDRIGLAIDRSKVSLFDAATTDRIAR